jgi:EAL domain-containing protein (putative c-di-GMP-specific phosphodiesterase class I)
MAGEQWLSRRGGLPRHGDRLAEVEAVIAGRRFDLVYQPILQLNTGKISGVEALCRFRDGHSPGGWFRRCAALGLAAAMDLAILEKACHDVERLPPGYLSVNLSAATLADVGALRDVFVAIGPSRAIVVELPEDAMVHDYDAVADSLRLLRNRGVLLAVDNAGAGSATFQHLLRLRPDIIKLDRSIASGIQHDPARRAQTTAVAIFAGDIGASVVAEGIECEEEVNALRLSGVSAGQGFWLAKPASLPVPPIGYQARPFPELLGGTSRPLFPKTGGPAGRAEWQPWGGTTAAIASHATLGSIAFVTSAVERLRAQDGARPLDEFRSLTSLIHRQLVDIREQLSKFTCGLTPEGFAAFDDVEGDAGERPP